MFLICFYGSSLLPELLFEGPYKKRPLLSGSWTSCVYTTSRGPKGSNHTKAGGADVGENERYPHVSLSGDSHTSRLHYL